MELALYDYWRSGAAWRTRIALNLKGLAYDQIPVDLRRGEQKAEAHLARNPQGLVPALDTGSAVLAQSGAIMEWLEEACPQPPLLPQTPEDRAHVRAMTALILCDIHPLNNLRVLNALKADFGADQVALDAWAGRWISEGFDALEALVARHGRGWCFGDAPTLADCALIPQLYSARRFHVALERWPHLLAVEAKAALHPAFDAARPALQPGADPA